MKEKLFNRLTSIRKLSLWLLPFMCIILALLASLYLAKASLAAPPKGSLPLDLPTVLSSMGTLSLFIFSMFIAVAAFVGWGTVKAQIRENVEEVTNKRLEKAEKESRGRSFAVLGYVIGENSIGENSVSADLLTATDKERLKEAISLSETGYRFLKGTDLPVEFMALNNILTYSCVLGEKERSGHLLEGARRLRAVAEDNDAPNLLLTYARTVLLFSRDPTEKDTACAIVSDIKSSHRLNEKQKREAKYLASLCEQRATENPGRSVP